jgi:hypothetical protein
MNYTDKYLLAVRLLGDLKQCLESESFLRHDAAKKNTKASIIVDTSELDKIAKRVSDLLHRLCDDALCNNNCKSLYFCERKRNHKGKHKEMGLVWD